MALRYTTTIDIDAAPERVWQVLTDRDWYAEGDNGVVRLEGSLAQGQRVKVFAEVSPGRAFPVDVREFDAPTRMVWGSGMPLGLFSGERVFRIDPAERGVRFVMTEEFSGLLLPLISRTMPDLQPSFDQFAAGLKAAAEQPAG